MKLSTIIEKRSFRGTVLAVILLNAVLVGVETYTASSPVSLLQNLCLWFFVLEIIIKFLGRRSLGSYLRDGWNIFDVLVVGAAFVPAFNSIPSVLRVVRVFRVLRLIPGVRELRVITAVLFRSLTSIAYVGLLMLVVLYVYAVVGVELFGRHQAEFSTLHEACFSLFQVLTGDDWAALRKSGLSARPFWVVTSYYVSWIVISAFVMINLVVGAIVTHFEEETRKLREAGASSDDARILELVSELQAAVRNRVGERTSER